MASRHSLEDKFADVVSGFIRRESGCHSIEIPLVIDGLCLKYYSLREQFNMRCFAGDDHEFDVNDSRTAMNSNTICIVDGNDIMDVTDESIAKYEWQYKLTQLPKIGCMHIGFESSNGPKSHSFTIGIANKWKPFAAKKSEKTKTEAIGNDALKKDDVIQMIFDVQNKRVGFGINATKQCQMYWKKLCHSQLKAFKYKTVIKMYPGFGIELMDFCIQHKSHWRNPSLSRARVMP